MRGEVIHLYAQGGDRQGIIQAIIPNWTGKIYTLPLNKIELVDRQIESGIYIIQTEKTVRVNWYVEWLGQGTMNEELLRLKNIIKDGQLVILTSSDEDFVQPNILMALTEKIKETIQSLDNGYEIIGVSRVINEKDDFLAHKVETYLDKVKIVLAAQGQTLFKKTEPQIKKEDELREQDIDEESLNAIAALTESLLKVNKETQTETTTEIESEIESEIVSELESEIESELESVIESEIESELESEIETETESEIVQDKNIDKLKKDLTLDDLVRNYDKNIYLYGDLLKLSTSDVEARGRLYKDRFELLGDTVINNRANRAGGVHPVTGKLTQTMRFNTMDEAGNYLMGDNYKEHELWCTINNIPFTEMFILELPEDSKEAHYYDSEKDIYADGYILPGNKFLLRENSIISKDYENAPIIVKEQDYVERNRHKVDMKTHKTLTHILFGTPTEASNFVLLNTKSGWGWAVWEDNNNKLFNRYTLWDNQ